MSLFQRLPRLLTGMDESVRQVLYVHGINCASHPLLTIYICFFFIVALSYPAAVSLDRKINGPAGYEPVMFWSRGPAHSATVTEQEAVAQEFYDVHSPYLRIDQVFFGYGGSLESSIVEAGHYAHGVIEADVLEQVHRLQQTIAAFATHGSNVTLASVCFKPPSSSSSSSSSSGGDDNNTAEQRRCLVNSPLEFWNNDVNVLHKDRRLRQTLSNREFRSPYGSSVSLQSIFGGAAFNETSHEIVFASSIVVTYFSMIESAQHKESIEQFWKQFWALQAVKPVGDDDIRYFVYTFTQSSIADDYAELALLALAYILVFLYFSLALGRVELVKSKAGLGLTAVASVFASLVTSLGICSIAGVRLTLVPWEILPFLAIFVGVENATRIIKAVVSTSIDLPVKERIGFGLSSAGPSMTRMLLTELVLLTGCSLLSVPALEEFCFFASVAIVVDYILHLTFFITILSIDIRRLELSDLSNSNVQSLMRASSSLNLASLAAGKQSPPPPEPTIPRKRSSFTRSMLCFGLLGLLATILFLSFGASAIWSPVDLTPSQPFKSAADDFWAIVNPENKNLFVQIQPPSHIRLTPPVIHRSRRPTAQPPSVVDAPSSSSPLASSSSSWPLSSSSASSADEVLLLSSSSSLAGSAVLGGSDINLASLQALSIDTWPYWVTLLSMWMPQFLPYLHQLGPLAVIFATVVVTTCFFTTVIMAYVMWPSVMTSLRRKQAASVAPDWAVGPYREIVLSGHDDEVECFDGGGIGDNIVVSAGLDRTVQIWEASTGTRLHVLHDFPAAIWNVKLVGETVVVGCADGSLFAYSALTGQLLHALESSFLVAAASSATPTGGATTPVDSSSSSSPRLRSSSSSIHDNLLSLGATGPSSEPTRQPVFMFGGLLAAPFSTRSGGPTSPTLATSRLSPEPPSPLGGGPSRSRASSSPLQPPARAHSSGITCLAVHEPSEILLSGSDDRTIKGWSLKGSGAFSFAHVFTLEGPRAPVTELLVHNDLLVAGFSDGSIRVYSLSTIVATVDPSSSPSLAAPPPPQLRLSLFGHVGAITAFTVADHVAIAKTSDAEAILVSGSHDGQIRVWDVSRGATAGSCLATLNSHAHAVVSLCVDGATDTLASGSMDETVVLWDLKTFQRVYRRSTPAATSLALRDSVLVMGEVGTRRPLPGDYVSYLGGGDGGSHRPAGAGAGAVSGGSGGSSSSGGGLRIHSERGAGVAGASSNGNGSSDDSADDEDHGGNGGISFMARQSSSSSSSSGSKQQIPRTTNATTVLPPLARRPSTESNTSSTTSVASAVKFRSRWGAPRHAGLSLLDLRTRTMLRRSLPLRARRSNTGGAVDEVVHRMTFVGDALVANCGDSVAVIHLSRSRVEKKDD